MHIQTAFRLSTRLRKGWCGEKESNLQRASWEARASLATVSLVRVGVLATRPPQERHSAPNTCHNGVCIVHKHLMDEVGRVTEHHREDANSQPKRDIDHRAD